MASEVFYMMVTDTVWGMGIQSTVTAQSTSIMQRRRKYEMSEQIRTDLAIEARGLVKRCNEEVLEEFQQPT
ncbi:MAG: hypothetical protein ACYTDV_17610 [Planctomycetota bacterium]|jgi:hypothetical protein